MILQIGIHLRNIWRENGIEKPVKPVGNLEVFRLQRNAFLYYETISLRK